MAVVIVGVEESLQLVLSFLWQTSFIIDAVISKSVFIMPNFRAGLALCIDLQFMNGCYTNKYVISIQRSHQMVDICRKIEILSQVFICNLRKHTYNHAEQAVA